MHAPAVGTRGRDEDTRCHFVTSDFALGKDHALLLQGRDRSKMYPADSGPVLLLLRGGGGARNNTVYSGSGAADGVPYGRGNYCAQIQKNDVTIPMSAEARLFSADEYTGMSNVSDIICSSGENTLRTQEEHKNRGNGMFLFDWPELGSLEDFETDLRKFDSPFEIGGNYFDDPVWPSICSPDVHLVPRSHFDTDPNSSTVANKSILQPTVPDSTVQEINMENPINARLSDVDLFCPFDDMLVPITSSIMYCNDEIIPSSTTLSGPDELVSAYVTRCSPRKKTHATTPDMMLDEMAENPLEMYFPPLTTYEQPEVAITGTSSTQMHHQLLPGETTLNSSGLEFGPKGRRTSGRGLRENPPSSSVTKAAPAKHLGFQKLQEGMNQLDVGTKTYIRDALYRLANNVEQRHCVDQQQTVGSSAAANRLGSSVWAETEWSPMDRSVAQLLLQKPMYQKQTGRQVAG